MKRSFFQIVSLLAIAAFLATGCAKTYRYDFKDGYSDLPAVNDSIALNMDTSMFHIDRSKYAAARLFPGLVGEDEPRLKNYVVNLDLNFTMPDKNLLRITVVPEPWFSTGLYAPAGELIEIDVPDNVNGLTAQIGVQTDNLTGITPRLRDPVLINRVALFPGKNYIRNLYGGQLIIQAARSIGSTVQLTVTGAVKSPDFVLGKTTDAEWKAMIAKTRVPWFEMRGKRIIFDLPVAKLQTYPLNDPTELMEAWDSVISEDYDKWFGLSDHPADPRDQAPELPWRVVLDIQPSVGYGHNGYPVVAQADDNWFRQITSVHDLRNSSNWGTLHELGHNYQMGQVWSWTELGEVSNNLHSFKVANRYGHVNAKASSPDFQSALAFAAKDDAGKKFGDLNVTERLTPFVQIFEKYGYGFMTYLATAGRHDPHLANNDQDKIDFFYEHLSSYLKMDMASWMQAWGLHISDISKNKISALYPPLDRDVWEYNPLTGQGGDDKVFISRSNWKVLGKDSENSGYTVEKMFDGDNGTFWNTPWGVSPLPGYPHYFMVDMTGEQTVTGFYFVNRSPAGVYDQAPAKVDIYVGDNPNTLTKVVSGAALPIQDRIDVDLPAGTPAFRYFKISFTEAHVPSQPVLDMAEVGIY